MKFIKSFRGARKSEAFPTDFKPGDECPIELERAAVAAGAVQNAGAVAKVPDCTAARKRAGKGKADLALPQA